MLLLPGMLPEAEQTAASIPQGVTPEFWLESLRFYELGLTGDPGQAAALVDGDDFVSRYNRAVLIGARVSGRLADQTSGNSVHWWRWLASRWVR